MHRNILNRNQLDLLPLIHRFSSDYYLAGGTAIALQLGHRRSIDFDVFHHGNVRYQRIQNILKREKVAIDRTLCATEDEFTIWANNVKLTFLNYPYKVPHQEWFEHFISMPSLLDLATMKALAMTRRSKWKDYVDMYFLLQRFSFMDITKRSAELFYPVFDEKSFRMALDYFEDIDYTEEVDYLTDQIPRETVQDFLSEIAIDPL